MGDLGGGSGRYLIATPLGRLLKGIDWSSLRASVAVENQHMEIKNVKEAARELVEQLPEGSTWDDLMHQIYVRQAIEAGLADSDAGRVRFVEEVRSQFGLKP
jgi:predicted transcriptional regulator